MMASHGVLCGRSFFSCCSASSCSALGRQLRAIQRAGNKRASGPSFSANSAAVETKTTVTTRFQLATNNTRVSVKQSKELESGQTAMVYYDSQDPRVSALEGFSEQSRKSMRFVYFLLLTLAATVAFILWDRAPHPL